MQPPVPADASVSEPAIRPASDADLPALVRLEARSFPAPWAAPALAAELHHPDALLLVAEDAAALLGYAAFRLALDEAELLRVAVEAPSRRTGVGRRLVETGLAHLRRRGARRCHLEVRADDPGALRFYAALAFHPAGRRPRYYPDGADALLLTRELAG